MSGAAFDPRLLGPLLAMVALTALVWLLMYVQRLGEMRRRRIDPQRVATPALAGSVLQRTGAADNFRNLFELPVLFYTALVLAVATGLDAAPLLVPAWGFVVLRCVHTAIQVGYNRVVHRFLAYVAGALVLGWLWVALAMALVGG